jgi:hypothetical protein
VKNVALFLARSEFLVRKKSLTMTMISTFPILKKHPKKNTKIALIANMCVSGVKILAINASTTS